MKSENLIIAEHKKAEHKGLCVADKKHIDEMWQITIGESRDKTIKPPSWQITFEQTVEKRSLNVYEEVIK